MGGTTTAKRGDARTASRHSSHLRHEVLGVLLIALSILALLSLVSFSPYDHAVFRSLTAARSTPGGAQNMIGTAGATLAGVLFKTVGGAAYLLPCLLGIVGLRCFQGSGGGVTLRRTGGVLASAACLSGLFHLELTGVPTLSSGMVSRGAAGGLVGQMLAEGLQRYFATTGAHIILGAGLLVSLLTVTPMSLAMLLGRTSVWWGQGAEKAARWGGAFRQWVRRRSLPQQHSTTIKVKPVNIHRTVPESVGSVPILAVEPGVPTVVIQPKETIAEPVQEEEIITERPVASGYRLPNPLELLEGSAAPLGRRSDADFKAQSEVLLRSLQSFGIEGRVTEIHPGPIVTMFEFEPAPGIKVARIVNLDNDLALALKATSLRIVAPIPGKSVVGIEVPNTDRQTVFLKDVVTSEAFVRSRSKLTFALGKDIFGTPVVADLKAMPHLLVAGATGAGKSVNLNSMLLSILISARPDEVKLLLIDPKMLEFQTYEGIPHLLRPVITDPRSAARGLGWVVQEMEKRYKLLAEAGVRNVEAYNRWVTGQQGSGGEPDSSAAAGTEQGELPIDYLPEEERLSIGEHTDTGPDPLSNAGQGKTPPAPLPYIVVMIDELADLMMVAPKDVEDKIARLAQMARAAGIHLILATQRPSVDVLTGLIKANFPARIAFQVSSKTDSRTILDANGAEALLGRGDMLYLASGTGRLTRIHGSFVSDDDILNVVESIKKQAAPGYGDAERFTQQEEVREEEARDEVYEQAKELVLTSGQASASLIQRRLRVGYPRAARMVERMEEEGLVGAPSRDGRREVIVRRGAVGAGEP